MTTYKSYEAAKIANPDSDIWHLNGRLFASGNQADVPSGAWKECNPADCCVTVEKFLADGHKFVEGDCFVSSLGGVVFTCGSEKFNIPLPGDKSRYILRAAALEKKPRTKVEYVKCEFDQVYLAAKSVFDGNELFIGYVDIQGEVTGEFSGRVNQERAAANYQHLYRRTKTPMTEREAFIDEYVAQRNEFAKQNTTADFCEFLADSGKFKLVN